MRWVQDLNAVLAWILAAVPIAIASPAPTLWLRWVWPRLPDGVGGLFLVGPVLFLAYILFGLGLMVGAVLFWRILPIRLEVGSHRMRSWKMFAFLVHNVLIMIVRVLFLPFTRSSPFILWFYRGMGAKIGKGVIFNSVQVHDAALLTIGDDAVIGGSAVVMAHAGHSGKFVMEPVTIGRRASIGERAIIMPGVTLEEGALVMPNTVVPRGTTVPAGTVYPA